MSTYDIVIEGRIQGTLMWALEGFELVAADGTRTCFRGEVADAAALREVYRRISGCNLKLRSVAQVDVGPGHDR